MISISTVWLTVLAFGAAVVNGAVGYGFSSTITPIALLWYTNKVLNPALVVVEIGVNLTLLLRERRYVRSTWSHARPVVATLLPGIVLGTLGLSVLAVTDVKLIVYVVLFPLVALQLYGFARPVRNERTGGAAVGFGIGFLSALTTISGPPLALFLRNQGLSKDEFRATIAQIRLGESTLTLATYAVFSEFFGAHLLTVPVLQLLPYLIVPAVVGIPLGAYLLGSLSPEFFRRLVMAVDGVFISYGLSVVLVSLRWVATATSHYVLAALLAVVAALAYLSLRTVPAREGGAGSASPSDRGPSGPSPPPDGGGPGDPALGRGYPGAEPAGSTGSQP
jgi:uncharacterized protein